jgi:methyltransferase family protein
LVGAWGTTREQARPLRRIIRHALSCPDIRMELMAFNRFRELFFAGAPVFRKSLLDVQASFGPEWEAEFDIHLQRLFGNDERAYQNAIKGYTGFALEVMRLQKQFNRTLKYQPMSYQDACENVYMNPEYMMDLYLPGIFVSHFLWRHHYRHLQYYRRDFLPLLDGLDDRRYYEVGTGTGFYTVQILRHFQDFRGVGIDISPHSREFTMNHVRGWGFESRFTPLDVNIIGAGLEPFPVIQTVEVLEHMSDPVTFLVHLRKLLRPGGYGYITAALTAPQSDHIYLYWTPDDVIRQLVTAGFTVRDCREEVAYQGPPGEPVPRIAAFIVS